MFFNSSALIVHLLEKSNLDIKFKKIYEICEDESDDLRESVDACVSQEAEGILERVLINEYHLHREDRVLTGETREERFNQFDEIISSIEFADYIIGKYEMLLSVFTRAFDVLFENIFDILMCYRKEAEEVSEYFGFDFGKMIRIDISAGDRHEGKTVAKVGFVNGELMYKPKRLLNDEFYNEFLHLMEREGVGTFKYIKTLCKNDHSWQECVQFHRCTSVEEAENYYFRAGVILSIMYILRAYDMHHENIICDGEYPMVLDLETIVSADMTDHAVLTSGKSVASSILSSGMLPVPGGQQVFDVDVCGLFGSEETSETMQMNVIELDDEYDIVYVQRKLKKDIQPNAVYVGEQLFSPLAAEKFIITGFINGGACIISNKEQFASIILDEKYEHMLVRQILRPTQTYCTFIHESNHPDILASRKSYNNLFEILYKGFKPSKYGYVRVDKEVDDLQRGNIPLFYTVMNSKDLFSSGEVLCEEYYQFSPRECVLYTLENLDQKMVEYQAGLIRLSIFTRNKSDAYQKECGKTYNLDRIPSAENIKTEIIAYRQGLSDREIYNQKTGWSNMNIACLSMDKLVVAGVDSGLYIGGGIVHFIYSYAKAFGDRESADYAKRIIRDLFGTHNSIMAGGLQAVSFSVYAGQGGLLYLAYNYYKLFQDKECHDIYVSVLNHLADRYKDVDFAGKTDEDFVNGIGGTMLVLSRIYLDKSGENEKKIIAELLKRYYVFIKEHALKEVGLAHGLAGQYINLSFMYRIFQDQEMLDLCLHLMKLEDQLLQNEIEKDDVKYSWCRGVVGVALARVVCMENLSESKNIFSEVRPVLELCSKENLEHAFTLSNPCLCHGIYGNLMAMKYIDSLIPVPGFGKYEKSEFYTEEELNNVQWFEGSDYDFEAFMIGEGGVLYSKLYSLSDECSNIMALEIY